jgi:glycosyltransferase involved in cell wall biosynthesis
VARRVPGIRLTIAGADPTPQVQALAGDNVTVPGFVDDLTPMFDEARVFIAPLRFGAGVKGKLLLSMANGLPAVASVVAVEGIPVVDGRDVLVAGNPSEWVHHIERLYKDDGLWRRLSSDGQALVDAHYSTAAVRRQVEEMAATIVEARVMAGEQ